MVCYDVPREMKIGFYALSIVYNLVYQIFYGLSFPCYVVFSQYPWVFIYLFIINLGLCLVGCMGNAKSWRSDP